MMGLIDKIAAIPVTNIDKAKKKKSGKKKVAQLISPNLLKIFQIIAQHQVNLHLRGR